MSLSMLHCESEDKINSKYYDVYSMLYDAVRAVDPDHIITLECIRIPDDLPHPAERGWENVMYQYHLYDDSNDSFREVTEKIFIMIKNPERKTYIIPSAKFKDIVKLYQM